MRSDSTGTTLPTAPATVTIDDLCTACGACLWTCPTRALIPASFRPMVVDARCNGCGECIEICPRGAIHDSGIAPSSLTAAEQ